MADSVNITRWIFTLGAKFLRIVPGTTAVVVLTTLISQIALLFAYVLPLKVIILLSSSGIPAYFPDFLAQYERSFLVFAFSAGAVLCYMLHLIAERLIRKGAEKGSKRLTERTRKMVLFENQDDVASRAYQRYSHALASAVFVGLAFSLLLWIYPNMAMISAGVITVSLAIFVLLANLNPGLGDRLRRSLRKSVFGVSGVGFLIGFSWMVVDLLGENPPAFVSALIGLLLYRQLLSRASETVIESIVLYEQRLTLNALFFHHYVLLRTPQEDQQGIWSLFAPERRTEWAVPVLREVAGVPVPDNIRTSWYQTGIRNVFALGAATDQADSPRWLLRIYDSGCASQAINAATLLGEFPVEKGLPTPPFLGATRVSEFHCHVFDWSGLMRVPPSEVGAATIKVIRKLLEVELPSELVARYGRSHPYLWRRLDRSHWNRLSLIADTDEQRNLVAELDAAWADVCAVLESLPLVLMNPELNADTLCYAPDGEPVATHWGRWSLDPIGSGWPVQGKQLDELSAYLEQAPRRGRGALSAGVNPADARLAAFVYAMEQLLSRQQYVQIFGLIPQLLESLNSRSRQTSAASIA